MGARPALTPEEIARIGELVMRPWGILRIAKAIGRDPGAVRRIVRRHFPDRPEAPNGRPPRRAA